jgi:demethylmenaquinone methyltransferase/2-methoxy-6-polyprenyl-1,4-benzoquinol methylase
MNLIGGDFLQNLISSHHIKMPVDKSDNRVRQMFGEIAPRYDLMNHLLSGNVDRYWRWRTVRLAPPRGESPILDVCTGTGDLALTYYRRTGGKIPIVATDFCPEMLAVGETKKRRAGINGQLTFVEADTQALPFENDRFQLVTVAFGLRNVADTDRGLLEMARVCQPGGRIAVLEFSMPRRQPMKAFYGFYFRHILPRIGHWIAKNSQNAYEYLPASVGEFPQGEALMERLRSAGLIDVAMHPLTLGIATLYIGSKPR